ncbi:MAG: hypothetical protein IMF11_07205 [Proteobacteria bacterium]|nr:hypothetical protein [Pseudomonadota bacterium]
MIKQRNTIITIVNNEDLSFVIPDPSGEVRILDSLSLDQFLNAGMESAPVPEELSNRVNSLLIVPDYWFGNVTYKFQSRKKSIIEAFIERKLLAEHPDLPDIKYFSGYIPHQIDQGEKGLYVYFLQEPKSLPDNFLIKEMTVEVEGTPAVYIKGVVKASGPDKLRDSISYLLDNLKKYFQGAQSLSLQNIDVELAKINNMQQEYQNYLVKFGFNLP